MAVGFPAKTSFADGNTLAAADLNDITGTLNTLTNGTFTGSISASQINGGQISGMRNALTNGAFAIDQRNSGATQTFTAAAALAYSVDRWYAYCTGANITGARVAGSGSNQYYYQFNGAASNTAVGFGQRIEAANSFYLASTTATISVSLASTSLTSITWTAYYANTTDTFGTLASPTRTSIATGSFTINSTLTRYSASIAIPAAATTGIEIVFTGGALLASQTLTFSNAQLELGSFATTFERRPIATELAMCQRYYFRLSNTTASDYAVGSGSCFSTTFIVCTIKYPVSMRVSPSAIESTATASNYSILGSGGTTIACSAIPAFRTGSNAEVAYVLFTVASGVTAGNASIAFIVASTSAYLGWGAEL